MRYMVKSLFSGWQEVTEDNYNGFIENIRTFATAMTNEQKEAYIKTVTKVEGGGNTAQEKGDE